MSISGKSNRNSITDKERRMEKPQRSKPNEWNSKEQKQERKKTIKLNVHFKTINNIERTLGLNCNTSLFCNCKPV